MTRAALQPATSELGRERAYQPEYIEHAWWTRGALIVLVALAVRVLALAFIEGEVNDGVTRIGTAASWFFSGTPTFGRTVWGEGNYVLPGLALLVWRDPYWSVRILYAVVAVTNVWIALRVTTDAFGTRAGAVTGWIVALMPFHVFMAANGATSEGPYITCVLGAVWAVMRYRAAPALRWSVLAGLALAVATTFRFDGVIWGLPLAAAFVLARPGDQARLRVDARTLLHLAAFGVCGLLYVAVIFRQWSTLYPSPWYPLDQAKLNTLQFFAGGQHQRWPAWLYQSYVVLFWPAATFAILTPGLAAIGWIGFGAVVRRGFRSALPLALGLVVTSIWLAFATFNHTILAQFRYALILAIVLAVFVEPGMRALRAHVSRRAIAPLMVGFVAVGFAWQAVVSDASLHDRGIITNQLRSISPVQRSQFATRDLLTWADQHATHNAPLVVSPHVLSSYFSLKGGDLRDAGRVYVQSYYMPNSQLVHSRASLADTLAARISAAGWVATTNGTRQLGLRDGMESELVRPVRNGGVFVWRGIPLTPIATWGDVQLWRVDRPAAVPAPVR